MTLEELNAVTAESAQDALLSCCGSKVWTKQVASFRPFGNEQELFAAAEKTWWELERSDWLEAFARHPRIGETKPIGGWSAEEQRGMNTATAATARDISEMNREYEARFGWVFLVCATGKTADEMRGSLEARLRNEPNLELRVAAGEQAKITQIRLRKLLGI